MPFHRYVALGDSFAEGVGDPDPHSPNGLRGWADRVAAVLAQQTPDFRYANLAIRGRKLDAVIAEQVEPAVALEPDLLTIYAGANDIMRPRVDVDALVERYDAALGKLAATGPGCWSSRPSTPAAPRSTARCEDGSPSTPSWSGGRPTATAPRSWTSGGCASSATGATGTTTACTSVRPATPGWPSTCSTCSASRTVSSSPSCRPRSCSPARGRYRANAEWTRTHFVPWVHRRVTRRSSGDTVSPKRPGLAPWE